MTKQVKGVKKITPNQPVKTKMFRLSTEFIKMATPIIESVPLKNGLRPFEILNLIVINEREANELVNFLGQLPFNSVANILNQIDKLITIEEETKENING